MTTKLQLWRWIFRLVYCVGFLAAADDSALAQFLRVVSYNIDADTGGAVGEMGGPHSGPGLMTVLQGIGNATLAGNAQPIDVLALQELNLVSSDTTGASSITLDFIVDQLNGIYGPDTYRTDLTFDPTTGGTGGGPNGLIYNTRTVQVLDADVIGSASGSGAPRAPMRYQLAPLGYNDHSADFWLYVSHMKSGSATSGSPSNGTRRNIEANTLRNDAAALGADAHVIYSGDFNVTGSTEAAYQTMVSPTVAGGVGQGIDVTNPTNDWNTTATFKHLLTYSATFLQYRDDFQFVTTPMLDEPGMQLVPDSYTVFGNGGGIFRTTVASANNTAALADLGEPPYSPAYRASVLTALTTTTDHLPIVADFSFASAIGIPGDYDHSGGVDFVDFEVWRSAFGAVGGPADGNHDGLVDAADYTVWRDHFGTSIIFSGAGAAANAAVPEPSAAVLFVLGACLAILRPATLRAWTGKNWNRKR